LSNYILDEDIPVLENFYPDFQLASVANAGHWVHAESPEVFLDEVLAFSLR
jgi:pimeloyl-ACP methyl ester carboxylesterase